MHRKSTSPRRRAGILAILAGLLTAVLPTLPAVARAAWATRKRNLLVAAVVWVVATFAPPVVSLIVGLLTAPRDDRRDDTHGWGTQGDDSVR